MNTTYRMVGPDVPTAVCLGIGVKVEFPLEQDTKAQGGGLEV
jgi:hypothetical protein